MRSIDLIRLDTMFGLEYSRPMHTLSLGQSNRCPKPVPHILLVHKAIPAKADYKKTCDYRYLIRLIVQMVQRFDAFVEGSPGHEAIRKASLGNQVI